MLLLIGSKSRQSTKLAKKLFKKSRKTIRIHLTLLSSDLVNQSQLMRGMLISNGVGSKDGAIASSSGWDLVFLFHTWSGLAFCSWRIQLMEELIGCGLSTTGHSFRGTQQSSLRFSLCLLLSGQNTGTSRPLPGSKSHTVRTWLAPSDSGSFSPQWSLVVSIWKTGDSLVSWNGSWSLTWWSSIQPHWSWHLWTSTSVISKSLEKTGPSHGSGAWYTCSSIGSALSTWTMLFTQLSPGRATHLPLEFSSFSSASAQSSTTCMPCGLMLTLREKANEYRGKSQKLKIYEPTCKKKLTCFKLIELSNLTIYLKN